MSFLLKLFSRSNPTPQVPQVRSRPAFTTSGKPQKPGTFTTVDPGTELRITSEKGEYRKTLNGYKFGIVLNQSLFQTVKFVKMEKIDKGEGYGNAQVGNRGRYDIFYTVELESGEELTFKENQYVFVTGEIELPPSKYGGKRSRKATRKVTRKPMRKSKK